MSKLAWCIGAGIFLGCATAAPSAKSEQSTSTAQATQPAAQQQDGAKVALAKKKPPKEGLICESYKVTGSHIRKEVCRTKEQAERDRQQAEKLLQEADRARPADGT